MIINSELGARLALCARSCALAYQQIAREVRRPVASVVACVGSPVAAVWKAPYGCGFGSEGGGGAMIELKLQLQLLKL